MLIVRPNKVISFSNANFFLPILFIAAVLSCVIDVSISPPGWRLYLSMPGVWSVVIMLSSIYFFMNGITVISRDEGIIHTCEHDILFFKRRKLDAERITAVALVYTTQGGYKRPPTRRYDLRLEIGNSDRITINSYEFDFWGPTLKKVESDLICVSKTLNLKMNNKIVDRTGDQNYID